MVAWKQYLKSFASFFELSLAPSAAEPQSSNKESKNLDEYCDKNNNECKEYDAEWQKSEKQKTASYAHLLQHQLNSFSIRMTGAIDLPAARMEAIPQLRYEAPNALAYIQMPMQMDFKNGVFLVEPSAISPYIDTFNLRINDKPKLVKDNVIRIQIPPKTWAHIKTRFPLKSIAVAAPKAIDEALASIDKQAFKRLEMDEKGKAIGAVHRIGLALDYETETKLIRTFFVALRRELAQLAKTQPQAGLTEKDYDLTLKLLDTYIKQADLTNPETANSTDTSELESFIKATMAGYLNSGEWYLDRKGRLLAQMTQVRLPKLVDAYLSHNLNNKTIRLNTWYQLDYSQPRFTLDANSPRTVDLSEYFPKLRGHLNKFTPEKFDESMKILSQSLEQKDDHSTVSNDDNDETVTHQAHHSKHKVKKSKAK
ncbi:hypothetical protein JF634_04600 [Simonsiella muelleri]|uniref:Uncharacterized protein n=1 Tax=Simonsiella muelleri ATCC 29453 TaxID=641147 RepID=V9HML5_9NEIS|nr:hypothetical protein [Simonsiella muelleri]AUX60413.1 hypothetical protein BWP33_00230 [Simonsiella muelleri ATCC 29453]EFG32068.1 hypothetical protein HMPREF9021_00473 [Simonsiella muelleri ATCC 29453]UBQ54763.1 hypothetical protein JF634_04600 [Simonsiella muelleri]